MRARPTPRDPTPGRTRSSLRLDEVRSEALASAQAVTTRAITYAQQLGASLAAPHRGVLPPSPAAPASAPSPAANAMTQDALGRLRDRGQRIVEHVRATELQIAARYDHVARSLVARTVAVTQATSAPRADADGK